MSMTCVSRGAIGTMLCGASTAFHWPWDGWFAPSLGIAASRLALPLGGKLVPALWKNVIRDTGEQLRGCESRRAS